MSNCSSSFVLIKKIIISPLQTHWRHPAATYETVNETVNCKVLLTHPSIVKIIYILDSTRIVRIILSQASTVLTS